MKRIIVDYAKLTNEILSLLVERFPDGYDDADVIQFSNAKGELIEAVEVKTDDTIYLVKVSTKLQDRIENFEEEEEIPEVDSINVKDLDIEEDDDEVTSKKSSKKKSSKKNDDDDVEEEEDEDFDDDDDDDFADDDDFEDDEEEEE